MSGAPAAQAGSAGVECEDGLVGAGAELAALAAQVPGLLVVSGPSGVGKGTLIARLMALHPHRFGFCTSHTTRGPRPGEVDGQHYHFTTQSAMQSEIARGAFLEHASVHGNTYGTSLAAVAAVCSLGKLPLLDIDVQGARKVRSSVVGGRAASVFVAPPSLPELEARLRGRATESEDRIQARLSAAAAEMEEAASYGDTVVNGQLDRAY
ncbi:P-loop containing nucleoside triphosphate hydrolase protein, partial [Haematococcus lacustris]